MSCLETYSDPSQASRMGHFAKIVNGLQPVCLCDRGCKGANDNILEVFCKSLLVL